MRNFVLNLIVFSVLSPLGISNAEAACDALSKSCFESSVQQKKVSPWLSNTFEKKCGRPASGDSGACDCVSGFEIKDQAAKKKVCGTVKRCFKVEKVAQSCFSSPVCSSGKCLPFKP